MRSHIKSLLLLLLATCSLSSAAAVKGLALVIYEKGKTNPVFECWLTDKPTMTFNNGKLTATAPSDTYTLEFTNVARMEFEEKEEIVTDVEEEMAAELSPETLRLLFLDSQTALVNGLHDGDLTRLYTIDGRVVPAEMERSGSRLTIYLGSLPQGVYIIRIGNQSFKIYKKS